MLRVKIKQKPDISLLVSLFFYLPCKKSPDDMVSESPSFNRGSLYVVNARWMATVEPFDKGFRRLMGTTADQSPGIMKRLSVCVL